MLAVSVAAPGPATVESAPPGEPGSGFLERLLDQQQGQGRGGGQKQQRGGRNQEQTSRRSVQKQTPARPTGRQNVSKQTGRGAGQESKAQRGNAARPDVRPNRAQPGETRAAQRRGPQDTRRVVAGAERGRGRLSRDDVIRQVRALPRYVRRLERSPRASDRLVVGAVARGVARGMGADDIRFERADNRLRVFNRDADLLFDMDERRALSLGAWDMRLLGDQRARGNAPAFCRSGAGHPVWGRQWCLDKGFGLGSDDRWIWSRRDVDDVMFYRRVDRDRLTPDVLVDVLGNVVFGRLALHALTLGFTQPLVGTWVAQPQGPRLLLINSGDYAVAELVDVDYDDRVDVLFVTQLR